MTPRALASVILLLAFHASDAAALSEVICTGDCNYDHTTAINELVTGVRIALDQTSIDACPGFDLDGDDAASIDELIGGVGTALNGCPRARLVASACEFTLPEGQPPASVQCGSAIVPEDRSRSDGRTVRIPFAVFKWRPPVGVPCGRGGCAPAEDPVVYLSGGPGGPTLEFLQFSVPAVFAPFNARGDLVFFDQRGTGRSLPSLDCPEWHAAFSAYLGQAQSVDADAAALLTAMRTCHDRLMGEGVNFAAYTSAASAHDLEDLMLGLGYQTWNLYGISYGTRLGATAIRDTPDHIRSVGLDSNVPVQENLEANFAADFERALNTLFAGCASDPTCHAAFPTLEQTVFDLVAELNAHPITLHPLNEAGEPFPVVVTGDRLLLGIQQALYDSALIPLIPLAIADTARGNYALLTVATQQIAAPSPIAWGMYYSVECNEEVPFITPEIIAAATAGVREEIKTVGVTYNTQLTADICAFWGSPPPPAVENEAVVSDLPVLVFAGEYDPITRPAYGQLVAETLSHSFFFEFPGFGHGVLSPGCATDMVLAFLADPTQRPDDGCIAAILPPQFVGRSAPPVSPVTWSACDLGFECGAVTVPVDYDNPNAGTLSVAVTRQPATDTAHRIGSLVLNPGGPGISGVASLRLLAGLFPASLRERFDLVSFDPRGTRDSGKIDCGTDVSALVSALPLPAAPGAPLPAAPLFVAMGEACTRTAGPLFPFVNTSNTARDLDRIRQAVGDETLTYLGLSYGTRLGAVYADLFPARVRALVLDGAVEPAATLDQQAREQAQAAEASLARFLAACRLRPDCPIGPDPAGFYDALKAQLATHPLPAPGGGDDHPVTVGDLEAATIAGISFPVFEGPQYLAALAAAGAGDGAPLRALAVGFFSDPDGPSAFDAYWTITCADEREHPSATAAGDLARELEQQYPRVGAYAASFLVAGCADWPLPPTAVPLVRAQGAAPIVVIGTTGDPNTPYAGAQNLAQALESAVLVTREGEGHTWFLNGFSNACVNDLVAAYLVDLAVPNDGTTCTASGSRQ